MTTVLRRHTSGATVDAVSCRPYGDVRVQKKVEKISFDSRCGCDNEKSVFSGRISLFSYRKDKREVSRQKSKGWFTKFRSDSNFHVPIEKLSKLTRAKIGNSAFRSSRRGKI